MKLRCFSPFLPIVNTGQPALLCEPRYSQHPFGFVLMRRSSSSAFFFGMRFVSAFSRYVFNISVLTMSEPADAVNSDFPKIRRNHRKIRERQKTTHSGLRRRLLGCFFARVGSGACLCHPNYSWGAQGTDPCRVGTRCM